MAKKVSVINMKGGVGKSTLSVNLAWHFAAMRSWSRKVLLVDLDPQFNSSQYMLGVHRYKPDIVDSNRPTVWDIFEQAARSPGLRSSGRSISDSIFNVVRFQGGGRIDIIPSQLELSYTLRNPSGKEHLLSNFIDDVDGDYDLVLIDCAPTESVLTTAAYLSADNVLIPVKPEFLSTIGLPLIRQSMTDFERLYRKILNVVGVCFNSSSGYAPEERISKDEVRGVARGFNWFVFEDHIPYSRSFPKGAREGSPIFRTSYAHSAVAKRVSNFCQAFGARLSL